MNGLNYFQQRANDAVEVNGNTVNGVTADIAITSHGSDAYFAICACMAVCAISVWVLAFMKPRPHRIFHYITAGVVTVAAIAYFSMGSNLGFAPIEVEFPRGTSDVRGMYREIFYVRYIDWFITTPLLLMDLMLTAGMPWPTILWTILVDEVMIVCGLVGALVTSRYKWGYFVFGCVALFYILYQLVWEGRIHAARIGGAAYRTYLTCGVLTSFLWVLYPVAWGVCEGGNVIAGDSEAAFYGTLDFLAKILFSALLLWGHKDIDPATLGLRIRDYDEDPAVKAGLTSEKSTFNDASNGAEGTTGTTTDAAATA